MNEPSIDKHTVDLFLKAFPRYLSMEPILYEFDSFIKLKKSLKNTWNRPPQYPECIAFLSVLVDRYDDERLRKRVVKIIKELPYEETIHVLLAIHHKGYSLNEFEKILVPLEKYRW